MDQNEPATRNEPDRLLYNLLQHISLNNSTGIICCPDLAGVTEAEIVQELTKQNVTGARRITVYKDGVKRETDTIVLTFNSVISRKTLKTYMVTYMLGWNCTFPTYSNATLQCCMETREKNPTIITNIGKVSRFLWPGKSSIAAKHCTQQKKKNAHQHSKTGKRFVYTDH